MKHVIIVALVFASIGTIAAVPTSHEVMEKMGKWRFVVKSVYFATKSHTNHNWTGKSFGMEKQPIPFFNLIAGLTKVLVKEGKMTDPIVVAASYLSLTIRMHIRSNQPMTSAQIESAFEIVGEAFGKEVRDLVDALTSRNPTDDLRQIFCDQVKAADNLSVEAASIRLASKLHVIRRVGLDSASWDNANAKLQRASAKYLLEKLGDKNPSLAAAYEKFFAENNSRLDVPKDYLRC